jgi:hypothetical protein
MALLGASTLLMLAGCNPGTIEPALTISPGFGESVSHNIAAQVINPQPVYTGLQGGNGRRAADAYARYELDRVIRPAPPLTGAQQFRPPPTELLQLQPLPAPGAPGSTQ